MNGLPSIYTEEHLFHIRSPFIKRDLFFHNACTLKPGSITLEDKKYCYFSPYRVSLQLPERFTFYPDAQSHENPFIETLRREPTELCAYVPLQYIDDLVDKDQSHSRLGSVVRIMSFEQRHKYNLFTGPWVFAIRSSQVRYEYMSFDGRLSPGSQVSFKKEPEHAYVSAQLYLAMNDQDLRNLPRIEIGRWQDVL